MHACVLYWCVWSIHSRSAFARIYGGLAIYGAKFLARQPRMTIFIFIDIDSDSIVYFLIISRGATNIINRKL